MCIGNIIVRARGLPDGKTNLLELTDEELMACYRIIESEYSAQ